MAKKWECFEDREPLSNQTVKLIWSRKPSDVEDEFMIPDRFLKNYDSISLVEFFDVVKDGPHFSTAERNGKEMKFAFQFIGVEYIDETSTEEEQPQSYQNKRTRTRNITQPLLDYDDIVDKDELNRKANRAKV